MVEKHKHDGLDSPKIKAGNLLGVYSEDSVVKLTGDQTINGVKTFTSKPVLPSSDPTADNEAVRKAYVDDYYGSYETLASDTLRDSADNSGASSDVSYTKVKDIEFNEVNGTIRVKFDLNANDVSSSNNCFGRIYVNNVAVGTERSKNNGGYVTFSEDIDVETGDNVQLYVNKGTATQALYKNFRLYYDKHFAPTTGTVNLN